MDAQEYIKYFPEEGLRMPLESLDLSNIPVHIAAIMDGNGRWAKQRGLSRIEGHFAGVEGVREIIRTSNDLGVRYLTIYSFSTENWERPREEVDALMDLFAETMADEAEGLDEENVRILLIGDIEELPEHTRDTFQSSIDLTAKNTGMALIMAVNYGGRKEIVGAAKAIVNAVQSGEISLEQIDETFFKSHLYTANIPDPDLLIRTSGEMRVSNFLLYQIAYSEIYVTDIFWPDFDKYELLKAISHYQSRSRRFGQV